MPPRSQPTPTRAPSRSPTSNRAAAALGMSARGTKRHQPIDTTSRPAAAAMAASSLGVRLLSVERWRVSCPMSGAACRYHQWPPLGVRQARRPPGRSTRRTCPSTAGRSSMCSRAPTQKAASTDSSSIVESVSAGSTRIDTRSRHGDTAARSVATRIISGDRSVPIATSNSPARASRCMPGPQPSSRSTPRPAPLEQVTNDRQPVGEEVRGVAVALAVTRCGPVEVGDHVGLAAHVERAQPAPLKAQACAAGAPCPWP